MNAPNIMLVAVEPSADALGAQLIEALRGHYGQDVSLCGCGGDEMTSQGFISKFSITPFSVMGFTDVAKVYFLAKKRIKELVKLAQDQKVDAVVFIDGWAFSRLGAEHFRKIIPNVKLFKYAAPQIWGSRPQRLEFVKNYFDGVLTLLPFEVESFDKAGVRASFIGHAVFQHAYQEYQKRKYNVSAIKKELGLNDGPVLGIMPGSRHREIRLLGPLFLQTFRDLSALFPNLQVIIPVVPAIADEVREMFGAESDIICIDAKKKYDAFSVCDVSLSTSGTVTTELAIFEVPQIIAYRFDWLTLQWAKRVLRTPYANILNYMAKKPLIPEYIQDDCTVEALTDHVQRFLNDPSQGKLQLQELTSQMQKLQLDGPRASDRAVNTISDWLSR